MPKNELELALESIDKEFESKEINQKVFNPLALAIANESLKDRVSLEEYRSLKVGTKIRSHYRSATMEGTIVSIVKKGSTAASTIYEIRPSRGSRHEGEPETVHRHGDKITVIKEFSKTKPSTEELHVSQEVLGSMLFLGGLFVLGYGLPSFSEWNRKRKNKQEDNNKKILKSQATLKNVKETLLNDKWLDKLTFKEGTVSVQDADVFKINNVLPTNIIDSVDKTIQAFFSVDSTLISDYKNFSNNVNNITDVIEKEWDNLTEKKYYEIKEKDPDYFKRISDDVESKLNKLEHPLASKWTSLPGHKTVCGGIVLSLNNKASKFDRNRFSIEIQKNNQTINLPTLDKEKIIRIGSLIKNLIEKSLGWNLAILPNTMRSLNVPYPSDGWPYEDVSGLDRDDVFPILNNYNSVIYDIGDLSGQGTDPIFILEYYYQRTIGRIIDALIHWIEASCNVRIKDNKPSTESLIDVIGQTIATETHKERPQVSTEGILDVFKSKPKLVLDKNIVSVLKKTYLNDKWLDEQKFKEGEFKYRYDHALRTDIGTSLSYANKVFSETSNYNLKSLKTFISQSDPIKKVILKNPGVDVSTIDALINKVDPLVLKDPSVGFKVETIKLVNRQNVKVAAELLVSAINGTKISTAEHSKLYDEIIDNYYDSYSLRSKVKDEDVAASLIEFERDKIFNSKYEYETGEDAFSSYNKFINSKLIYPLIELLKQSIK